MNSRRIMVALAFGWMLNATSVPATAQGTWRVSVDSAGLQADWNSFGPSVSEDGRFVNFGHDKCCGANTSKSLSRGLKTPSTAYRTEDQVYLVRIGLGQQRFELLDFYFISRASSGGVH